MNSLLRNILDEVSSYYGKMLLTEARKDMDKVIQSFRRQHPDMDVEGFKEMIRRTDPDFQVTDRDLPDGRHLHFEGVSEYGQWVGNRFVEGNVDFSDAEDLRNALELYNTNRQIAGRAHPLNTIATKEELYEIAQDLDPDYTPTKDIDSVYLNARKDYGEGNEIVVLNDRDWLVKVPLNYETSRQLAGDAIEHSSGWCTGYSENMFNHYRRSDKNGNATNGEYYIIYSKRKPGKRWQFHPESNQLRAPHNRPTGFSELNQFGNARTLINLFKKLGKDLNKVGRWLKDMPTVTIDEVDQLLAQGEDLKNIFDDVTSIQGADFDMVGLEGKANFISGRRLMFPEWLDSASNFFGGKCTIQSTDGKFNILDKTGGLIVGDVESTSGWLDFAGPVQHGCQCIAIRTQNGPKYNYVMPDGTMYAEGDVDEWLDMANLFKRGYAPIGRDGKYNMLSTEGVEFSDTWYDWMTFQFNNGLMGVGMADADGYMKYNFVDSENNLMYDRPVEQWFDEIGYNPDDEKSIDRFHNGYIKVATYVGDQPKENLLSQNGELAWPTDNPEQWFDKVSRPFGPYALVMVEGNGLNVLRLDGSGQLILKNDWLDDCDLYNGSYFYVMYHGRPYYMDMAGNFYDGRTKQPVDAGNGRINERALRRIVSETIAKHLR